MHCGETLDKRMALCKIKAHSDGFEEFFLLGYNAMQYVESQPTFRRSMYSSSE
jgi:hypothetical protein